MDNEKLFELITKMYGEMQDEFKEIKSDISEFRIETNTNFNQLNDKINDLEATNATNHIDIKASLSKVQDDLDFLSHKEFQTEKEMYHIKKRLNKKRRDAK